MTPSKAQIDHGSQHRDIDVRTAIDHQIKPGEGAHHEHFAVREIEQLQHAENQRIADGNQGVRRPEHQAVDQLLIDHRMDA